MPTVITLATVGLTCAAGGLAANGSVSPQYGEDPGFIAAAKQAREQAQREADRRATPQAREDRQRSRHALAASPTDKAIEIADGAFPDAASADVWKEPGLGPDDRVESYTGVNSARIVRPDGSHAIVESSVPLQARDDAGHMQPVELKLEDRGDYLAPANPIVPVRIAKDARDGVWFPTSGIGFKVHDAPGRDQSDGTRHASRVFHGNVKRDTDFFVQPIPSGVETFFQLRSVDSPEQLSLDFDLPSGAKLIDSGDGTGSAVVGSDGKSLASISPIAAQDADGQPVPVSVEAVGNRLALRVDHRAGDFKYPILIDPNVSETNTWPGPANDLSRSWIAHGSTAPGSTGRFTGWMGTWNGVDGNSGLTGLNVLASRAAGQNYYQFGDYGEWYLQPYRANVRIPAVYFTFSHWPRAQQTQAQFGIWHSDATPGTGHFVGNVNRFGNTVAEGASLTCAGAGCRMDQGELDAWPTFALVLWATRSITDLPSAQINRVDVYYGDTTAPGVSGVGIGTRNWADTDSVPVTGNVTDSGIGLAKVGLRASAWPAWSGPTTTFACSGGRFSQCPESVGNPPTTPALGLTARSTDPGLAGVEGAIPIQVYAQDKIWDATTYPAHETSASAGQLRIDRSPPTLNPASTGPLSQSGAWLNDQSNTLTVNPNDAFSGVQYSQLQVKSEGSTAPSSVIARDTFTRTATNGWGSADRGGAWTVGPGTASNFSVNGSRATAAVPNNVEQIARLPDGVRAQDVDVSGWIVFPSAPPSANTFDGYILVRDQSVAPQTNGNFYRVGLFVDTAGKIWLRVKNQAGTIVGSDSDTGMTLQAGASYRLHATFTGSSPTTIKARAWKDGTAEPTTWPLSTTDSTLGPQGAGRVGLRAIQTTGASSVSIGFDDLLVTSLDQWVTKDLRSEGCDTSGCPTNPGSRTLTWNSTDYAEGPHDVRQVARDPVAATGANGTESANHVTTSAPWTVNLDRTPPVMGAETGLLATKSGWIKDGNLDLTATATDARSGPKKIELFVDNVLKDTKTAACGASCPSPFTTPSPLQWNSTGSTNPTPTIQVKATDLAGNPSATDFTSPATDTWTLHIDRTNPTATASTGDLKDGKDHVLSGGPYHLQVNATDGTPQVPSSGVASVQLLVDDQPRGVPCNQTASGDSQPLPCPLTFSPTSADEGKRKISVLVKDRVGNQYTETPWYVIFDHNDPRITDVTHTGLPSGWTDAASPSVQITARDDESGVKKIDLYTPSALPGLPDDAQTWDAGCAGTVPDPCSQQPTSHTFSYGSSLPEGNNRVHAHAEDAAAPPHVSTPDTEWRLKIDRSAPQVTASGSLTRLGAVPIIAGSYDLHVSALDGDASSPSTERSGAKSIDVLVRNDDDPNPQFVRRDGVAKDCAEGSCPLSFDWFFRREDYKPGHYTVRAQATDMLGHVSTADTPVQVTPAVLEPRQAMGLEDYWQYQTIPTGGGTAAHVNLATGNVVWHSTPIVNPGRGLSTVANLTYNSQSLAPDPALDYNEAGQGFSLGIAGITRVNEPLDVSLAAVGGPVFLTDPDGTRHTFDPSGSGQWYVHPAGVDLFLRRFAPPALLGATPELKAWAATRPDGVTYYFDEQGYASSIQDRNGNVIKFEYYPSPTGFVCDLLPVGLPPANPVCRKKLQRVVDPAGVDGENNLALPQAQRNQIRDSRSVSLTYHDLIDVAGIHYYGRVTDITDHAARTTELLYGEGGGGSDYLTSMTQAKNATSGDPMNAERIFRFGYETADPTVDPTSLAARRYMTSVTDPQHASTPNDAHAKTVFDYESRLQALEDNPQNLAQHPDVNTQDGAIVEQELTAFQRRRIDHVTARGGGVTTFGYSESQASGERREDTSVTDPRSKSVSYSLDERARPRSIVADVGTDNHPATSQTRIEWDDNSTTDNNVETLTKAGNDQAQSATTTMLYNANGQLSKQTDPNGHETDFEYRPSEGNQAAAGGVDSGHGFVTDLTAITTPRAHDGTGCVCKWSFTPDDRGNVSDVSNPEGDTAHTEFDSRGQITEERDWHRPGQAGNKTTYSDFDANGLPQTMVDPRGNAGEGGSHTWHYYYDAVGNLRAVTDPRGSGQPGAPPSAIAAFTTSFAYDNLDRLRTQVVPKDSTHGDFVTRTTTYDVNDNVTSRTDGTGARTDYSYTPMDHVSEVDSPATDHQGEGSAAREVTKYTYDANQNQITVESPNGTNTTADPSDSSTRFVYDDANRKIAQIRRSHDASLSNPEHPLITTYRYDLRGNLTSLSDANQNHAVVNPVDPNNYDSIDTSQGLHRFDYHYDGADNRIDAYEDPSGLNLHTHYGYDANDNLTQVTDPNDHATTYGYDTADRSTDVTNAEGDHTHYELRPDGKLGTLVKPNAATTGDSDAYRVKYDYNGAAQVTAITLPRAPGQYGPTLRVRYGRDEVGNPTTVTDARGSYNESTSPSANPYSFTNSFYDTGELKTTTRPSWWRYTGGSAGDQKGADIQERGVAGLSGGSGDASHSDAPGGAASVSPDGQDSGQTGGGDNTPPGNLGSVNPQPMPDLMPKAGSTSFEYDGEMRLTKVTDAAGSDTQLERDAMGRIYRTTRPFDGATHIVTSQGYDRNGNLVRSTNGRGFDTTFGYDQFDRRLTQTAPGSGPDLTETTTTGYDDNGNTLSVKTPRDTISTSEYDAVDRQVLSANPLGDTTTYRYDGAGNRTAERAPRGNTNDCHFNGTAPACAPLGDTQGNCISPDTDPSPGCFETRRTFDGANRVHTEADGVGSTTTYSYDHDGNQTRVVAPGSASNSSDVTNEVNAPQITDQTFDGRDLPWAKTTGTDTESKRTSITEYDGNGNLRREVNPAGVGSDGSPTHADAGQSAQTTDPTTSADRTNADVKNASYNAKVYEYSADNVLTATHLPWGNGDRGENDLSSQDQRRFRIDYTFDSLGRNTDITTPYEWTTGASSRTADHYTHFDNGWTATTTDSGGDTVNYGYDDAGDQTDWRVGPTTNPTRHVTRNFFPSGTLASRTASGAGHSQTYSYSYNKDRALTSIDYSRSGGSDPDHRTTTIGHDEADRQLSVQNSDGDGGTDKYFEKDTLFAYDADGNVSGRYTDGNGSTFASYAGGKHTSFAYDALDRERTTTVARDDAQTHVYESSYYPSGQRATLVKKNLQAGDPVSNASTRASSLFYYADDGRTASKQRLKGDGSVDETHDYAYDDNGDRSADERGSYSFNAAAQLTAWTPKPEAPNHDKVDYTVDGAGNVTHKTQGTISTSYEYPQGRLTQATTTAAGGGFCSTRTDNYSYGEFGKLASIVPSVDGGCPGSETTSYDYDNFDRLVRAKAPPQADQTYSYDGLDRRDQKCKDQSLASPGSDGTLSCSDGHRSSYAYVGTSRTLSSEHDNQGGAADQTRGYDYSPDGAPLGYQQQKPSDSTPNKYRSYDSDAQGSVTGLEQDSGVIASADRYHYDPFGELQSNQPQGMNPVPPDPNADAEGGTGSGYSPDAQDNPLRFQGFYYDSGVKLYDMQARSYRPQLGRFLQADRLESSQGDYNLQADPLTQDRYAFAGGNPVNTVEWDGHEPVSSFHDGTWNACNGPCGSGPRYRTDSRGSETAAVYPRGARTVMLKRLMPNATCTAIRCWKTQSPPLSAVDRHALGPAADQIHNLSVERMQPMPPERCPRHNCENEMLPPDQYRARLQGGNHVLGIWAAMAGLGGGDEAAAVGVAAKEGGPGVVSFFAKLFGGAEKAKSADEGIYVIRSERGAYVGQSGKIPARLDQHVSSGRFTRDEVSAAERISVAGGRARREIAEQQKIDELGGIDSLLNLRNPIGPRRFELMPQPYARP